MVIFADVSIIFADATTDGKESAVFPSNPTVYRGWMIAASSVALLMSYVTAYDGKTRLKRMVPIKPSITVLCVGVAWACFNAFSMSWQTKDPSLRV